MFSGEVLDWDGARSMAGASDSKAEAAQLQRAKAFGKQGAGTAPIPPATRLYRRDPRAPNRENQSCQKARSDILATERLKPFLTRQSQPALAVKPTQVGFVGTGTALAATGRVYYSVPFPRQSLSVLCNKFTLGL